MLVITQSVEGTATNVARRRVELCCERPLGHAGAHRDERAGEEWDADSPEGRTILRHEEPG
ncbi:MAG TPA: hypothetical protein VKZ49_04340 [Polyangiaceae bacterium]|nr:hypothetical protein [Polyangiaceae bacterium]